MKVLFYSPYSGHWYLHTLWEGTIAKALEHRGAQIHFIGCDRLFSACDIFRDHVDRTDEGCAACQHKERQVFAAMELPHSWLGDHLTEQDRADVRAWSAGVADDQLLTATFDDHPLGEWCKPSLIAHFRQPTFEVLEGEVARVCRGYLEGAALALRSLGRYLDAWQPDVVVTLNGTLFTHRVAFELARERGIRVVIHERASLAATLNLRENMAIWDPRHFDELRTTWQGISLSTEELRVTAQYLHDRRYGRNLGWYAFTRADDQAPSVTEQLGLDPDKPITALFTTSQAEASVSHWQSVFGDQFTWVQATIDFFAQRPERHLVIRIHPNEDHVMGRNDTILARYRRMAEAAPPNVSFVWPKDSLSSYGLMDVADVALVYYSSVGIEMAATWGKPVVTASQNGYSDWGFTWEVPHASAYVDILAQALATPPSDRVRALAMRYLYRQTIWNSIPFPMVTLIGQSQGKLAYRSSAELAPGLEPNLDRIAEGILGRQPIYPPPSDGERQRTVADEERFLATYVAGPDGFRKLARDDCRVSVVLYIYNYAHYLEATIDSILAQTYQDFELYVLDDGSTDGTPDLMQKYLKDPRVRYEYQENKGRQRLGETFNRCLEATRGEYIVIANGDDIMVPEKIERQLAAFQANPGVEIVFHGGTFIDAQGHPVAGRFVSLIPEAALVTRTVGRYFFSNCSVPNPTVMFRRTILKRIGLQEYGGVHDYQFWLKAGMARCRFMQLPEDLIYYRVHEESQSTSSRHQERIVQESRDMLVAMRQRYTIEDIYPEITHCQDPLRAKAAAHVDLGVLIAKNPVGCLDLAIVEFKQALQLQPDCARSQNNLACCYLIRGQRDEGLAILRGLDLPGARHNLEIAEALDDPKTGKYELLRYDPGTTELYQVSLPAAIDPRGPVEQATVLAVVDATVTDHAIRSVLTTYFTTFGPHEGQTLVLLTTSPEQTERLVDLYGPLAPPADQAATVALQQVRADELESIFLGQLIGARAVVDLASRSGFVALALERACPVLREPTSEQLRASVAQVRTLPALPPPPVTARRLTVMAMPDWSHDQWQSVVSAYTRKFDARKPVTLRLWVDPAGPIQVGEAYANVAGLLDRLGVDPEATADMELFDEPWHPEEAPAFFTGVDTFISSGDPEHDEHAAAQRVHILPLTALDGPIHLWYGRQGEEACNPA